MVRIGIVGCGGIANGKHITSLLQCRDAKITAICDIDPGALKRTGDRLGLPAEYRFADYHDLIACPEVDAVEVCTPNYVHVDVAVAAVKADKPVHVEKPLSISCEMAQPLADALKEHPVVNMMCFSYRYFTCVRYAKWIMEQGLLGDIVSVNVSYWKDSALWPGRRLEWRFIKKYAGTGVLGDLGAHLVDMVRFLVGEFDEVCSMTGTVVKERKKLDSEEYAPVETDDYCNFLARVNGQIPVLFSITRAAVGETNTIRFDIHGTKGVISSDLNHPDVLSVCVGPVDLMSKNIHTVPVPRTFAAEQEQTFVDAVSGKNPKYAPTIADGMACQRILDALLESDEQHRWVKI